MCLCPSEHVVARRRRRPRRKAQRTGREETSADRQLQETKGRAEWMGSWSKFAVHTISFDLMRRENKHRAELIPCQV